MYSDETLRRELLAKIQQQVEFEPEDCSHFVNLTVFNGIATIRGSVPSYADKAAVLKILEGEKGILGWTDGLAIEIPEEHRHTDAEIAGAAREAVDGLTTVRPGEIRITVDDGWIYLEGTVEHWCQREAAEYAVQCLTGLRGVLNLIWAIGPKKSEACGAATPAAQ